MAGAELKENPGAEVDDAAGVLRSMMFGLGVGMVNEPCTLTPSEEDVGLEGDEDDTENGNADDPEEELNASAGLKAGADEQASPVTVNVAVESNRTVTTPSVPVAVNADGPFATFGFGFGVAVISGAEDDGVTIPPKLKLEELVVGVKEVALDGTIPPKLNVLEVDEGVNWRLFSLMTAGGGAGPLRLMTEGLPESCGAAA